MKCKHNNCKILALPEDEYCFVHSQDKTIVVKRKAARSRGGKNSKLKVINKLNIQSVEDVRACLEDCINELRTSQTESKTTKARTIGYLCSIMLTTLELGTLEERISRLEQAQAEKLQEVQGYE